MNERTMNELTEVKVKMMEIKEKMMEEMIGMKEMVNM